MTHQHNSNPYINDPDVLLMMEFQKGNKASFESLMNKYYPRLLNFIYRFVNNRHTAEELTQEVFIKVYNQGASYRPMSKFQTWVFTIAKNTSLNELRRRHLSGISLNEDIDDGKGKMQRQVADERVSDPQQQLMQEEKVEMIRQAIASLPENQRMAVILRRYDEFSYAEIAETLDCSVEAVKSLLSRAKENLKQKLVGLKK